ncbi:unnamed protein product, partial [Didymodactylos carnosus]
MISMPTPELIDQVERSFLCSSTDKNDLLRVPLLEEFENEMKIYEACRNDLEALQDYWDVNWVRIDLRPIKQTLSSLAHKWLWKFCEYIHNQTKQSLDELDVFLKQMEPEIESITGLERDTATFMKIMRLFNSVSSKQQEVEVKFELMRRTLSILKTYSPSDTTELNSLYNSTIQRWQNLKTKVMQAKQRLGPTLQEESTIITKDLEKFASHIEQLRVDMSLSRIFSYKILYDDCQDLLNDYQNRYKQLDKQAADYKQLQSLLNVNIVDFTKLNDVRDTLRNLRMTWKTVRDIRRHFEHIKNEQWQRLNSKEVLASCDKDNDQLIMLPKLVRNWEVYTGTEDEIKRIKICAQLLDDLSNPALRTRHWKQLIRLTGGNSLMDSDSFRQLTFGQLFKLGFQDHAEDIRATVKRAEKDFQLETTLKSYEEIWLSKTFELILFGKYTAPKVGTPNTDSKSIADTKQNSLTEPSRHSAVTSVSKTIVKSRASIGSLSQSLLNIDTNLSDRLYLLSDLKSLFEEIEDHQLVLEMLQTNQSAGSFLDEIAKWQLILQNIEAVLKEWNYVQKLWLELEPIYTDHTIQTQLSSETPKFVRCDRDFKALMVSVGKNNNVLKCCQKKNILNMLKYLSSQFVKCQNAYILYLNQSKRNVSRFYYLSDDELCQLLTCVNDIRSIGFPLSKVIPGIGQIIFSNETSITKEEAIGYITYDGNEKVLFSQKLLFENNVEQFVEKLVGQVKLSIKEAIDRCINDLMIPGEKQTFNFINWLFDNPGQAVVLTLKILFTTLIENALNKTQQQDLEKLSSFANQILGQLSEILRRTSMQQNAAVVSITTETTSKVEEKTDKNPDQENSDMIQPPPTATTDELVKENIQLDNRYLLLTRQQIDKLLQILNLISSYIVQIRTMNENQTVKIDSYEWLVTLRYYHNQNDKQINIKCFQKTMVYNNDLCSNVSDLFTPNEYNFIAPLFLSIGLPAGTLVFNNNGRYLIDLLSACVGRSTFHLQCNNNTTSQTIVNYFQGLCLSDDWTCFNSLNHLSYVSLYSFCQLSSLLYTAVVKQEKSFDFMNAKINLSQTQQQNYFSTFYSTGDESLTLKSQSSFVLETFRIVSIIQPNYEHITYCYLSSYGFQHSSELSKQLINLLTYAVHTVTDMIQENSAEGLILPKVELNPQLLKMIVQFAYGYLSKSDDSQNREQIEQDALALSLMNMTNFSKCTNLNSSLFIKKLIRQTWPHITKKFIDEQDIGTTNELLPFYVTTRRGTEFKVWNISDAIELALEDNKYNPNTDMCTKILQLYELVNKHDQILVVGKSEYGKSACIKTLSKAMNYINGKIHYHQIMIQLWSEKELFSSYNNDTGLWHRGLLSCLLNSTRSTSLNQNQSKHEQHTNKLNSGETETLLIHMDGIDVDNSNMMEHFFVENKLECPNGDRTRKEYGTKLFWELEDISNLSPRILTSVILLHFDQSTVTWRDHILAAFSNSSSLSLIDQDLLKNISQTCIEYANRIYTSQEYETIISSQNTNPDQLDISFESKIAMVVTLLKGFIKNERCSKIDVRSITEFCLLWTFVVNMDQSCRPEFDNWWRVTFRNIPKEKLITDWLYDIDSHQFILWSDTIPAFNPPAHQGIPINLFVHTPYTMALSYLVSSLTESERPVMVVGETGVGRTSLVSDRLKATCGGDISDVFYITVNCNGVTDAALVYEKINEQLSWKHGSKYTTKGNRKMYCFIDDLHLAKVDRSGKQSLVELLRQHLDSGGLYSYDNYNWQEIDNIIYVVTFNPYKNVCKSKLSRRLLKHFHILTIPVLAEDELISIFVKLLNRHLIGDVENIDTAPDTDQSAAILPLGTTRINTATTVATTTTSSTTNDGASATSSNVNTKDKLSTSMIKRLKRLKLTIERIVCATIDLNQRMSKYYFEKSERLHYIFSMKQLTILFRHLCISLTPECKFDDLFYIWHHECDWLYGKRLIDKIDYERYRQLYAIIIKKYFPTINEQHVLLMNNQYFSNLQVTESGMVVANLTRDNQNYLTDNYAVVTDFKRVETLVHNAIIEYNKEKPKISFPLYE